MHADNIVVLGYGNADNNCIRIPFIYNIYFYIYSTYEYVIFKQFVFFML
jgi:hypothetical protein